MTAAPQPRHARARTSMPAEAVALGRLLIALVLLVAVVVGAVALAAAARAASDDATPYSVTPAGITFPEPLAAHGHVNIRLVDGRTAGLHLDPNNGHPGARWIGTTFLPWSAFGITDGCIAWVQWSGADEHFGEGGQSPVCLDDTETTPCPDPTSTTTPTSPPSTQPSTSSTPSPTASPTAWPTEAPTPYPTSQPSSTPRPTASPTSSPTSAPSPTSTSVAPSASPSPAPTVSLAAPPAPTTPPTSPTPLPPTGPELAATGVDLGLAIFIIVVVLVGGVIAIGISGIERRNRGEDR